MKVRSARLSVICVLGATCLWGTSGPAPASTAGTLSLAEPLVAVTLGALLFGEKLALLTVAGGCVLLAGIAFTSRRSIRRPAPVDALVEAAS